ncbi:MAG TPA: hypothetical protein VG894_07040 [Bauldia sp.]|nr:hypothetical protein [Bauldia sp.]
MLGRADPSVVVYVGTRGWRATNLHAREGSGLVERLSLLIGSIDAAGRLDAG